MLLESKPGVVSVHSCLTPECVKVEFRVTDGRPSVRAASYSLECLRKGFSPKFAFKNSRTVRTPKGTFAAAAPRPRSSAL